VMWRSLLAVLLLAGCTLQQPLPPALPEEPVVFTPPPPPLAVQDQKPVEPLPEQRVLDVPVSAVPVITPTRDELAPVKKPGVKERPEKVIKEANAQALVTPTTAGYRDGRSVVQRYPYVPGQMYEIYSAPKHPTTIVFPPGEYLAIGPDIDDQNAWDVAEGEMGEGPTYQQFVKIRPVVAGLDHTTSFMMQSGLIIPCRLRSFPQTSMVVVTWDMPRRPVALLGKPLPRTPAFRERKQEEDATPKVDPARLHTAYSITATQGNPPWVPLAVYDDGTKTVIKFKESLGHTQAPAPFAIDAEGKLNLVQFIPYQVPGEPAKGTYYILQGLWPKLELRGDGGQIVTIVRQTGQLAPYQAQKEPTS